MNKEDVKNKIKEIIKRALEGRAEFDTNVGDDVYLVQLLGINSIEAIEIIVRIENEFDIELDDEDLNVEFLKNINSIADYIMNKTAK